MSRSERREQREGERRGGGRERGRKGGREGMKKERRECEWCLLLYMCVSRYRRMGVIGAVMIIQQLGLKRDLMDVSLPPTAASQGPSQQESTLPPARKRQASSCHMILTGNAIGQLQQYCL